MGSPHVLSITWDKKEERQGDKYSHCPDFSKAIAEKKEDDEEIKATIPMALKAHLDDDEDDSTMLNKGGKTFRASAGTRKDHGGDVGRCNLILTINPSSGDVTHSKIEYTRDDWEEEGPLEGFSVALVEATTTQTTPKRTPKRKRNETDDDDEQTDVTKKQKKQKKDKKEKKEKKKKDKKDQKEKKEEKKRQQ